MAINSDFDNRYVSLVKETTFGTAVTVTSSNAFTADADDESFTHNADIMQRADMSRPISTKSVTGREHAEGSVNGVLQPDDFAGSIITGILPRTVYNDGSSGAHDFYGGNASSSYPSFTVRVGREDKEHLYTGQSVNRLSFGAAVGEYCTYSCDFVGKAESTPVAIDDSSTVAGTSSALNFSTKDGFHFADGTVFLAQDIGGTSTAKVKSLSIAMNLNRDIDNSYAIGSNTCVRQPPAQMLEITGSLEFNQVIHSIATSTSEKRYQDLIAADGVLLNESTSTPALAIQFAGESGADFLKMRFFKLRFSAPTSNVSGRDTQTMSVDFTVMADENNNDTFAHFNLKGSQRTSAY